MPGGGRDDWGLRMDSLQCLVFDGQGGRRSDDGMLAGNSLTSAAYRWSNPLAGLAGVLSRSMAAGRCKKWHVHSGLSLHVIGLGEKGLRHPGP